MDLSSIIAELALKHNLPKKVVESISHAQWSFVKDRVTAGTHESVLLNKLGKFAVKPNRLKYLYERHPHLNPETKTNNSRMGEFSVPKSTDRTTGTPETPDLSDMQQEQA